MAGRNAPPQPPRREDYPAIRAALLEWWRASGRSFPWRQSRDPYLIFVAETVLQKTQVAKAGPVYQALISRYPTVEALASAPIAELEAVFRSLGLIKRARFLRDAAVAIMERFGGKIPQDRQSLKSLPGVGDYTANAILCFAYGQPLPIVDGAIARVLRRVLGLPSDKEAWEDPTAWKAADALLDREKPVEHNYALLDLAVTICLPRQPLHEVCPLREWCLAARQRRA